MYNQSSQFIILLFVAITFVFQSIQGKEDILAKENYDFAQKQLTNAVKILENTGNLPRSTNADGTLRQVEPRDWTTGFFPGCLWYIYEYTQDDIWKKRAKHFTHLLEEEQYNVNDHDIGFRMYCSYGNGLRLTKDSSYVPILVQSAKSLMTRFNSKVGCIQSWSKPKWIFPVIIDNMMNLELLFWATKATGDSSFYQVAVQHAETTMKNHFREDHSSWHLLEYDTLTTKIIKRQTVQGAADESAWARGQTWGLYGFTMCYRETRDERFLKQAEQIADFLLNHPNLPEDMVPYWDFNAPNIPNEPRDTSAGAIMCSAFYELSTHLGKDDLIYKKAADEILESLSSPQYRAKEGENNNFILMHGVGHLPGNKEIDVPLIYGDYYFLEANLRKMKIESQQ